MLDLGRTDDRGRDTWARDQPGNRQGVQGGIRQRVNTNITATVQYGFYKYDEPTSAGWSDYMAHLLFGAVTVRLP